MRRLQLSTFWKLAGSYLALMLLTGSTLFLVVLYGRNTIDLEVRQRLAQESVELLRSELQPLLSPSIEYTELFESLHRLRVLNPEQTLLFIDRKGNIRKELAFDYSPRIDHIDVQVVEKLLSGEATIEFPILGDNPLHESAPLSGFAAARIQIAGEPHYLYLLLASNLVDDFYKGVGALRSGQRLGLTFIGMMIAASCFGVFAFFLLTRRFYRLLEVVESYRNGNFEPRLQLGGRDEIAGLADTLNSMAETIVENMDALQKKDDNRRELVSAISHDLRGPLMSIQGYSETLETQELSPEEQRSCLSGIEANCEFLKKLISQLFELSKLEAKQVVPEKTDFFLHALCEDAIATVKPLAAKKNVVVVVSGLEQAPPVRADRSLLQRVMQNLLENAVRHSPEHARVQILLSHRGREVEITISDQGSGIPEEKLPRIFERLYRIDPERSKLSGGAGLGLAIVKEIIELHDSQIRVSSGDKGTQFTFALPIATQDSPYFEEGAE